LLAFLAAVGCHHPKRITDSSESRVGVGCDWLHDSPGTSASIDHITVSADDLTPPRTPSSPEATEIWELSLGDAIAIALQNSEVVRTSFGGSGFTTEPGTVTGATNIGSGTPGTTGGSGTTIYDPAIAEQRVAEALAVFDTTFAANMFWTRIDQPPGVVFGGGIPVPNQRDQASFNSSLSKLLVTGATAGVNFNTNYLFIPPFRTVSTSPGPDGIFGTPDDVFTPGVRRTTAQYTPNVEFTLRQPLLRGAGSDFNRAPIVIARLQSDITLWDFKQAVLGLVRSVEAAYWDLQSAHVALRTIDELIPYASEAVRLIEVREEVGTRIAAETAQARTQFLDFRQQRVQTLATTLDRETTLRNLMGLPPSDGRRIVPSEAPRRAPIHVDWPATVRTALDNRPDIVRGRLSVRVRELQILLAKNALQPSLDVEGLWRVNGLDNELDEAIGLLTDNQFTDWQLSVSFSVPIGFRQASANVQAAGLRLDRDRALLRQTIHATTHRLGDIIRDLESLYGQYQLAVQRLNQTQVWVKGRFEQLRDPTTRPGEEGQDTMLLALTNLQEALLSWRSAATDASSLLAQYNASLAQLEETKGTLLSHYGIQIAEDPIMQLRFGHLPPSNISCQVGEPLPEK
jgi:outer membrane protein TolC